MQSFAYYRLAVSVLFLAVVSYFWATHWDDLAFHSWQNHELIDMGDATSFVDQREQLKPNSWVKVSGILGTQAASLKGLRAGTLRFGPYEIRHLLGSKLYIEYDQDKYHEQFSPLERVSVSGRLVSLGADSKLQKVRDFFASYYRKPIDDKAMLVIVDETPRSQWRYAIFFILSIIVLFISFYSSFSAFKRRGEFLSAKRL